MHKLVQVNNLSNARHQLIGIKHRVFNVFKQPNIGQRRPQMVVHVNCGFISFQQLMVLFSSQAVTQWRQMKIDTDAADILLQTTNHSDSDNSYTTSNLVKHFCSMSSSKGGFMPENVARANGAGVQC